MKAHLKRMGLWLLAAILMMTGLSACGMLWQERMIFYPVAPNSATYPQYRDREFRFDSHGYEIQAWMLENPAATTDYTLLYYGGNAEDVTLNFDDFERLDVKRAFYFNYRGYGHSEGKPSQKALFRDALASYDHVREHRNVRTEEVVVMGRSLGAAVATYLAAHRPVARVILVTPFDSLRAVGKHHFPFLPVKWFLRHPFPAQDYAAEAKAPALMLTAGEDRVVPNERSLALHAAWRGRKHWRLLDGAGHNSIHRHPDYYATIRNFLAPSQ